MSLLDTIRQKNPSLRDRSDDELKTILRKSPEFTTFTDEQFDRYVSGPDRTQPAKAEKDSPGFTGGLAAGVDQVQAMGGGLLQAAGDATESDYLWEKGRDIYQDNMAEAEENALGYGFTDIQGAGDAWNWARFTAGNLLPTLATSVAGGGVGGIAARALAGQAAKQAAGKAGQALGAMAASTGMETGAIMGETQDLDVSLAHGALAGSLDALLPFQLLRKAGADDVADQAASEISDNVLRDLRARAVQSGTEAASRGSLTGLLTEAPTEGLQGLISQHANYWVENNGESLLNNLDEVDVKAIVDEAAAGGLMGGALGAPTGLIERGQANAQLSRIEQARDQAAAAGGDALDQVMAAQGAESEVLSEAPVRAPGLVRDLETGETTRVDLDNQAPPEMPGDFNAPLDVPPLPEGLRESDRPQATTDNGTATSDGPTGFAADDLSPFQRNQLRDYGVTDEQLWDMPTNQALAELDAANRSRQVQTGDLSEQGTGVYRVPTDQIQVDPEQYQFRSRVNQDGVDERLSGVTKWDDNRAGTLLLHRRRDGSIFAADGHHRRDLALRLGQPDVNARILEEADGFDVPAARVEAAMANIADGKAEALDVAKVFRDVDAPNQEIRDLFDLPRNQVALDGEALANLSDNAFGLVAAGQLSEKDGAAIGASFDDPAQQEAAVRAFQNGEPKTAFERQLLVNEIKAAGFVESQGDQGGLFGDDPQEISLLQQRLSVLNSLRQALTFDKKLFGSLNKNADRAGEAGNKIATEANKEITQESANALEMINRVSTTPALNEMVNRAARRLVDGEKKAPVVRDLKAELRAYEQGNYQPPVNGESSEGSAAASGQQPIEGEGLEPGSDQPVSEGDLPGSGEGGQPQGELTPDLELESQSEADLAVQELERQEAERAEAEARRKEEERIRADEQLDDFTLSGSDRPVDVAESRGQGNMFDVMGQPAEAEPEPQQSQSVADDPGQPTLDDAATQEPTADEIRQVSKFYEGNPASALADAIRWEMTPTERPDWMMGNSSGKPFATLKGAVNSVKKDVSRTNKPHAVVRVRKLPIDATGAEPRRGDDPDDVQSIFGGQDFYMIVLMPEDPALKEAVISMFPAERKEQTVGLDRDNVFYPEGAEEAATVAEPAPTATAETADDLAAIADLDARTQAAAAMPEGTRIQVDGQTYLKRNGSWEVPDSLRDFGRSDADLAAMFADSEPAAEPAAGNGRAFTQTGENSWESADGVTVVNQNDRWEVFRSGTDWMIDAEPVATATSQAEAEAEAQAIDLEDAESDSSADSSPERGTTDAAGYGKQNTVFTEDRAQAARDRIRRKLGQLNSGLDPELVVDGITLAGYHIEAGARSFTEFARTMLDDLGEGAKPYLASWYEGVRRWPGFNAEGMTPTSEVDSFDLDSLSGEPAPQAEGWSAPEIQLMVEDRVEAIQAFHREYDGRTGGVDWRDAPQGSSAWASNANPARQEAEAIKEPAYHNGQEFPLTQEQEANLIAGLKADYLTKDDRFKLKHKVRRPLADAIMGAPMRVEARGDGQYSGDVLIHIGGGFDGYHIEVSTPWPEFHSARIVHTDSGKEMARGPSSPLDLARKLSAIHYDIQRGIDPLSAGDNDDVPGSNADLERDSENAEPGDELGTDAVRNDSGADGEGAGAPGGQAEPGRPSGQGGAGVSGGGAASGGKRSDQPVHPGDGEFGAPQGAAGSDDAGRGREADDDGVRSEPRAGQTADDVAAEARQQELDKEARKRAQAATETADLAIEPGSEANIAEHLPMLLPDQQGDVAFFESRLLNNEGHGVLTTNGTGTGKTFSGLGLIKRYERMGRDNIMIVVPNNKIAADWKGSGQALALDVKQLRDTQDNGGRGIVVTTYANFRDNLTLLERDWDLLVFDESHYLHQSNDFDPTEAEKMRNALTGHPRGRFEYHRFKHADDYERLAELLDSYTADEKVARLDDTRDEQRAELLRNADRTRAEHDRLKRYLDGEREKDEANREALWDRNGTDTLMLSATPFPYRFSLDSAEGYLFDYEKQEPGQSLRYNSGDAREKFFMANFGYRMRYNKLTQPEKGVDLSLMERQFAKQLQENGVMRSRMLEVDQDYDRRFYEVQSQVGLKVDEGLTWLDQEAEATSDENLKRGLRDLGQLIRKRFDYLSRAYFLEAVKAKEMVPTIREHLRLGRKVVVFHDFNKGGGFNPFNVTDIEPHMVPAFRLFKQERPDLQALPLNDLVSPRLRLSREFPNALFFNGQVPKGQRIKNADLFNDDDSGRDLIVVQSDAGREGVSMHDITGNHQRVLINLGLPSKPIAQIQTEGRIYRTFVRSNAIQRLVTTGLSLERWAIASKLAARSGTAENLAMGEQARGLKDAILEAYEMAGEYPPGHEGEGTGGKERDRALIEAISDFDRAKTYYFGTAKNSKRRDQREGKDYYATPEPLGQKMVEWADVAPNEKILEPSAGHGAILRWMPEDRNVHFVEPSSDLASKAALNAPHAEYHGGGFEDLNIVNKFDAVVMNPPYVGGLDWKHIAKAAKHLPNGGRIVALVPRGGAADKRQAKFLESDEAKQIYTVGEIELPAVTFERAGTGVRTKIVILERHTDSNNAPQPFNRSLDYVEEINELFDEIEGMAVPDRTRVEPAAEPAPAKPAAGQVQTPQEGPTYATSDEFVTHVTKRGKELTGVIARDLTKEQAKEIDPYTFKKDGGFFIRARHVEATSADSQEAPAFMRRSGATTSGLSERQVQATVDAFLKAYPGADNVGVEIHRTAASLPGYNSERDGDGAATISGQYVSRSDTLHLVAGAFSSRREVQEALQEEILVHKGLGFFAPADREQLYRDIQTAAGESREVKALWDQTVEDYQPVVESAGLNQEQANRLYAEELLGALAQDRPNWMKRGWRKLWRGIKRLLVKAGWIQPSIGTAELRDRIQLIGEAFQRGQRAPRRDFAADVRGETSQDGDVPAFSMTREEWRKANRVTQRQKRVPAVQAAAQELAAGRLSQSDYIEAVRRNQPIQPLDQVPQLPTLQEVAYALDESKAASGIVGLDKQIEPGTRVGLRLDIPAYDFYDTFVVSIHDGQRKSGKVLGYSQTGAITNVEFMTAPKGALRIATGDSAKAPIARMHGDWFEHDAERLAQGAEKLLNAPGWTQVGLNMFRHSWFYDKADGMPLASAERVIQVGPLVLAKGVKKISPQDDRFRIAKDSDIRFSLSDNDNSDALPLPEVDVEEVTNDEEIARILEQYEAARSDQSGSGARGQERGAAVGGRPSAPGWQSQTAIRGRGDQPAVIFRGSQTGLTPADFQEERFGFSTGHPSSGLGVFFTSNRADASGYGNPEAFYLDMRNPLVLNQEDLPSFNSSADATRYRNAIRAQGYDGIVVDYSDVGGPRHYIPFEPEQAIPAQEKGNARYRLNGHSKAKVLGASIRKAIQAVPELAEANIVETTDQLPEKAQVEAALLGIDPSQIRGLYVDGELYVVASNIETVQEGIEVALHEAVGHKGIRGVLGKDLDSVMLRLYRSLPNSPEGREALAEIKRNYPFLDPKNRDDRIAIAEEMVSHLLEKGYRPKAWQRAVAKIRDLLRKLIPSVAWTYTDVLVLGEQAREHLRRRKAGSDDAVLRYSLASRERISGGNLFDDFNATDLTAAAKIGPRSAPRRVMDAWKEATQNAGLKIRQGMVDRLAAFKEMDERLLGEGMLQEDITRSSWVLGRMANAANGALHAMLHNGRIELDREQKVLGLKDDDSKGLGSVFAKLASHNDPDSGSAEVQRFMGWIAGNRARKLLDQGRENLFSEEEIGAMEAWDRGTLPDGRNRAEVYQEVFAEFQAYRDDVLAVADQAGLLRKAMDPDDATLFMAKKHGIRAGLVKRANKARKAANRADDLEVKEQAEARESEALGELQDALVTELGMAEFDQEYDMLTTDQRELWANEFYVPFYRINEDEKQPTGQLSTNGLSRQQAYKRLKGGTQNLNDLLENTMMNFHHLLDASLKNQAAQQAVTNAQQLGMARRVPASNRNPKTSTFILEEGEKVYYQVDDPLVFQALTALSNAGMNNMAMKIMRGFKRLFTNMTTTTPQFMVANLIRDSLQATATNEVSKNAFANVIGGARSYKDQKTRAQMMASGASFNFGHLYGNNPDELRAQLTRDMRGAKLISKDNMGQALVKGWDWWNNVNNATENLNRAAIFTQNQERGKLKAAFESRDLIDFSAHGAWPAVRILIDIVPFLNARIQGLDKIYRSGIKPGASVLKSIFGGDDPKVSDKQAAGRFWSVTGALALATIALYLHNEDDEEYQKLEEWQKDTYWFVRFGDQAFFIPKPFEVGAIATMAERITEQFVNDKATGKVFRERMYHMVTDTFAFSPVPQAVQPVLDVYANYDAFTQRPIESMGMERLSPELRKRASTSKAAEWISNGLNATVGALGDPDTNPLALSPVQVDHLIGGYLGQVGTWAASSGDVAWRVATGKEAPARRWYEYQPVRRFYSNLGDEDRYTRYGTVFYEGLREAGRAYSDVKELREMGRLADAAELAESRQELLALRTPLNRAQRRLREINRKIDVVRRANLDGEVKRQQIDRLRAIKNQIQRALGERVEQARAR